MGEEEGQADCLYELPPGTEGGGQAGKERKRGRKGKGSAGGKLLKTRKEKKRNK